MNQGQVVFVSRNRGIVVVQHSDGFAVVELLGSEGEFQMGHSVNGCWEELGGESIYKDNEEHDAFFQGSWGSLAQATTIARNIGGG